MQSIQAKIGPKKPRLTKYMVRILLGILESSEVRIREYDGYEIPNVGY